MDDIEKKASRVRVEPRRENRLAAVQCVYMWELNRPRMSAEKLMEHLLTLHTDKSDPERYFCFAAELVSGVLEHMEMLDSRIETFAQNWSLERISKVELSILRVALYELYQRSDIPPVVSINEAIELAKQLSGNDSKRFINGLLDRVKVTIDRPWRKADKDGA